MPNAVHTIDAKIRIYVIQIGTVRFTVLFLPFSFSYRRQKLFIILSFIRYKVIFTFLQRGVFDTILVEETESQ